MASVLDAMERLGLTWSIENLEALSDWAEELKVVPSTTVTSHRRTLVECAARITRLTTALEAEPVPSPPRKSSRILKKPGIDASGTSIPVSRQLKPGETFINAIRVSFDFLMLQVLNIV